MLLYRSAIDGEHECYEMILDLLRVLPAAILVGLVPGYYWSRFLFPAGDLATRLVYSAGFSMSLVPAVMLVPARAMGLGVTFSATVLAALLVFGAGMAAFLLFGPAKEPGEPPPGTVTRPGLRSLLLLGAAFAVAVPYSLGLVSSPFLLVPVGVLVVLSGFSYVSGEKDSVPGSPVEVAGGFWDSPVVYYPLLCAVALVVLVRGYVGPVLQDWPYIRGVDHYSHAVMANQMLSKGSYEEYLIYPPGFHTMTAMVSRLSGLEPIDVFPVLGPVFLLLPTFALYTLGSRLWGREYGLVSAAFGGVLVGGSYLYFNDSMYPNLVASQFLLVLTVAALVRLYGSATWRAVLAVAVLGSSVVLYHQVSSLYLALLLAIISLFLLPYLLVKERRKGLALFSSFALLTVLSFVYAWDTYGPMDDSGESETGAAVDMAIGTQLPYSPEQMIGEIVSQPVTWLGILGVFLLLGIRRNQEDFSRTLSRFTLLAWTFVILLGTVTSLSGFPQRFGRDLGVPLSLVAAFALVVVFRSLRSRGRPVFFTGLAVLLLTGVMIVGRAVQSFEVAAGPSVQMVISEEIYAAGEWLEDHNTGGSIMVSPHVNQVPSRVMLALGDYSGLQSFDAWQIEIPRDLPPTGPEPLLDVFWVMQNPASDRARELIEEYDVRYVVLYKDMPDRPIEDIYWPLFERRPDLYRTAFENSDVLIVQPRFG